MKKGFNTAERQKETKPEQTRLWKITATHETEEEEKKRCVFVSTLHACVCGNGPDPDLQPGLTQRLLRNRHADRMRPLY